MKGWKRLPSMAGGFAPTPNLGAARIITPGWHGKGSRQTGLSWASRFSSCQELAAQSVNRVSHSGGMDWRPSGG